MWDGVLDSIRHAQSILSRKAERLGGGGGEGVELAARIPEETRSSHSPSGAVM